MTARRIGRGAFIVLGTIGAWLALDELGFLDVIERAGVFAVVRGGGPGMLCVPIAIGIASAFTSVSSPLRAGLALGLLAPSGVVLYWDRARCGPAFAIWCTVAFVCAVITCRAVQLSREPAAVRLALTSTGVGALLCALIAAVLSWPQSITYGGPQPRAFASPLVVLAATFVIANVLDLRRKRTRALVFVAAAGLCLAVNDDFGGVNRGCIYFPGPLELLVYPALVAPAVLLLWLGPVVRFLRRR